MSDKFDAGQVFKKDDVLLTIDSRDYELALAQAEATVAQADLRLQMEEKEAAVVRREWQLLNQGKPSGLQAREPQLAQARAALAAAKAARRQPNATSSVAKCAHRLTGWWPRRLFGPGNLPRWPCRLARFSQPTLPR